MTNFWFWFIFGCFVRGLVFSLITHLVTQWSFSHMTPKCLSKKTSTYFWGNQPNCACLISLYGIEYFWGDKLLLERWQTLLFKALSTTTTTLLWRSLAVKKTYIVALLLQNGRLSDCVYCIEYGCFMPIKTWRDRVASARVDDWATIRLQYWLLTLSWWLYKVFVWSQQN